MTSGNGRTRKKTEAEIEAARKKAAARRRRARESQR